MTYQGIVLGIMLSMAIGAAIYNYLKGDWGQHQHQYQHQSGKEDPFEYMLQQQALRSSRSNSSSSKRRKKENEKDNCPICLEDLIQPTVETLSCGHMFHVACIRQWFKQERENHCPICRKVHVLRGRIAENM